MPCESKPFDSRHVRPPAEENDRRQHYLERLGGTVCQGSQSTEPSPSVPPVSSTQVLSGIERARGHKNMHKGHPGVI